MRKIIFQMMVTLDGFFEGPNGEIDWHRVDDEFNEYAVDLLGKVDTLLFGRVTYDLMAGYWPTPAAVKDDPIVAGRMNDLPKIVFSRTLNRVEWQNTKLIKDNIADEVLKLKNQSGRDMAIFGSSNLALTFIKHGLIDEFRIMVNPVVLGNGKTLFDGIDSKLNLKLVQTKIFGSGLVSLHYKPD